LGIGGNNITTGAVITLDVVLVTNQNLFESAVVKVSMADSIESIALSLEEY